MGFRGVEECGYWGGQDLILITLDRHECFSVFLHLQKDKQRKQHHSLKLGKKRRESSKRNYYIISPRVIIKAIIIILFRVTGTPFTHVKTCLKFWGLPRKCVWYARGFLWKLVENLAVVNILSQISSICVESLQETRVVSNELLLESLQESLLREVLNSFRDFVTLI
jgi:hypothetical protein